MNILESIVVFFDTDYIILSEEKDINGEVDILYFQYFSNIRVIAFG